MRFWKKYPEDITPLAHNHRATLRDGVLGIGPEGYAEFDTVSLRRIAGFSLETSLSPFRLEGTVDDSSNISRAAIQPPFPTPGVMATQKRWASASPPGQPELKRARLVAPPGGNVGGGSPDQTSPLSSQYLQRLEDTVVDNISTLRAATAPPLEAIDVVVKRPASTQPADEPDPKRIRVPSTLTPFSHRSAKVLEKRRALGRNKARTFIPSDASPGSGGFEEAPIPPARYDDLAAKLHALKSRVTHFGPSRDRVFIPVDWKNGGDFEEMLSSFCLEVEPTLSPSTKAPDEVSSKPEQVYIAGIEAKNNVEIGNHMTDKNRVDKNKDVQAKNDQDKVGNTKADSNSDGCEVIEPVKWKQSVAARLASAKKNRGTPSEQPEVLATEHSPSVKKPAAKGSNTRGKAVAQATKVNGSKAADDDSAKEKDDVDDDEEESEYEDPKIAKNTIAQAEKRLSKACRSCKIDANKEWRDKHQTVVSSLNREHKAVIKILKDTAAAAMKQAKATADKAKRAIKDKAELAAEDAKNASDEKFDAMKAKLDAEVKGLKKNLADEKTKVEALKLEVDNAGKLCKKVEKDAADKVKTAEADLKAGDLKLREKWKQLKREAEAISNELKPEHSKLVKAKEKTIKELTQGHLRLEKELERSEEDVRHARTLHGTEKNHHEHALKELKEAKARVKELEAGTLKYNKLLDAVKDRAKLDLGRAEEEIATLKVLLKEQSSHVVDRQRDNRLLQDAVRTHAKLAEQGRDEIAKLEKKLQAVQAELEVALEMDKIDESVGRVSEGDTAETV